MLAVAGLSPWDAPPDPFHNYVCFDPWPKDEYEELQHLSNAINGAVFLYRHLPTNALCAVKRMPNQNVMFPPPRQLEDAKAEIGVSSYLAAQANAPTDSVRYTMGPAQCFQDAEFTYFVSEFAPGGELFAHVSKQRGFPEAEARVWAKQIVEAVACLHANGVASRDVSLENVLLASDSTARLIDFGQAVHVWDTTSHVESPARHRGEAGKRYYMAPEMLLGRSYEARPVDAFAVGVLIFILVAGLPPWELATRADARFAFVQRRGLQAVVDSWGLQMSPVLVDLLQRLLRPSPQERMTIEDALNHEWFQQA
jgi:serine/threonine protein kinase